MLIAQITDTHIVEKNAHWLGIEEAKTDARLKRVISYLNTCDPKPDLVVLTGDATDGGKRNEYLHLIEMLSDLQIPYYLIPGNHDQREVMREAFKNFSYMPKTGFLNYAIDTFPIRLLFLDTLVEGQAHGEICQKRMEWLKENLKDEKPALLFMHHPLATTGNTLFDAITCHASSELETFLQSNKSLLAMFSGHYHHLCLSSFADKMCFIAPSVAPTHYFAHPNVSEPTAIELEDPAITFHKIAISGKIITHIVRLKDNHRRIDWSLIKTNQRT